MPAFAFLLPKNPISSRYVCQTFIAQYPDFLQMINVTTNTCFSNDFRQLNWIGREAIEFFWFELKG